MYKPDPKTASYFCLSETKVQHPMNKHTRGLGISQTTLRESNDGIICCIHLSNCVVYYHFCGLGGRAAD